MEIKWTPGTKIALWGAGVAALVAIAAWVVVPQLQHATHLESPKPQATPADLTASPPGRVVGVFAASIQELRARNHVTLIPASETLTQMPGGSYGFVFAPYLAHSSPGALRMYTHNDPAYFEVHKLTGSQAEFIGYVRPETQERLQKGLGRGEKLTLYSSPLRDATNLTAISLRAVKCTRSQDVAVRRKGGTIVLFALFCKAR